MKKLLIVLWALVLVGCTSNVALQGGKGNVGGSVSTSIPF